MLATRAGIIPYFVGENNQIEFAFMVPSNPAFGGELAQIAKGRIDSSESPIEAALREGQEELGLLQQNLRGPIDTVGQYHIKGDCESYYLKVYTVEVHTKENFTQPHFETGSVVWLTADQFQIHGRETQAVVVAQCAQLVAEKTNMGVRTML